MKVTARKNKISDLPKSLQKYAYGQDQDGIVHINIGEQYDLYGIRYLEGHVFYLVPNPDFLWWMPATMYEPEPEEIEKNIPEDWVREEFEDEPDDEGSSADEVDVIIAPKIYHDNMLEIEDRTAKGQEVMMQMKEQMGD